MKWLTRLRHEQGYSQSATAFAALLKGNARARQTLLKVGHACRETPIVSLQSRRPEQDKEISSYFGPQRQALDRKDKLNHFSH